MYLLGRSDAADVDIKLHSAPVSPLYLLKKMSEETRWLKVIATL